ncbi:TAXI family TRAP transporter solute-binding subunit [Peptoniphilus catoniae]|uniref:TAXI family TRAP transporter solute-binding subunit n=1 Tax=Peptoniphilus catoniae TaxID=1660341 RepID=UPI0010FDCC8F|nr:TAXI family TRAP transporter solute-binding subunit [Peptoniphilus catoniae]
MKKTSKLLSLLLAMVMMLSVVTACGKKENANTAKTNNTTATENNAKENSSEEPKIEEMTEVKSVGIGTASIGGALYAAGGALVNEWQKVGVSASAEVTGGSIQNCNLIESGEMLTAIISQGTAYQASKGEGLFEGQEPAKTLRAGFCIQPAYMHAWTLDQSAEDYSAFEGKIACGGPAGGTSDQYTKNVLEILGVKPSKFVNAAFSDSPNMLRDKLVDIFGSSMGTPASAVSECANTLGAKIIGISDEQADKVIPEMPFFMKVNLPAGTYPGQDKDVPTLADYNVYFFRADMPEEIVYEFTKAVFENKAELVKAFAGFETMDPELVKSIVMPLHKGAYKYYQEMGIEVPDAAKPID